MRLIYLSPVPWNSFSQRPHELVRYFHSSTGGQVLWIDPYPTRFPALSDLLNKRPNVAGTDGGVPSWLSIITPMALPIEPMPLSGTFNRLIWHKYMSRIESFIDSSTVLGIGKPSEMALQLLKKKYFVSSFYDGMDDFPAFYSGFSRLAMMRREQKIVSKVRTVLTSSSSLYEKLKALAPDVRLVLNACASDRMPAALAPRTREDAHAPVIGYVGTIAHWFDWELVLTLAEAYPLAKFQLIGPVYERPRSTLPENIFLRPSLPHFDALQLMAQFDIGLIPFKRTLLTSSVDPIKYYEYRALGVPVISSRFGQMKLRNEHDGVWLIDHDSNVREVIDRALADKMREINIAQFREDNSWESRFNKSRVFEL